MIFSIQNIVTNELKERNQDELKLRTLLNDLSELREDMINTNYLNL
jgi:hypothetical protein